MPGYNAMYDKNNKKHQKQPEVDPVPARRPAPLPMLSSVGRLGWWPAAQPDASSPLRF